MGAALICVGELVWACCLPLPAALEQPLDGTLNLQDFHGRTIAQLPSADARVQIPVPLAKMGEYLPRVTIALEDKRFASHHGIDLRAVCSAVWRDLRSGRIVSGGSTITEQLIKLATGRQGHSWTGKLREAVAAWKLEHRWDKSQILAAYLNRASYGNRRLGPEAAAQAYFGKSAAHLTLAEAIYLAGLPQAPSRFNPWLHPAAAAARYKFSLDRLAAAGVITQAQRDLLAAPPTVLHCEPPHLAPNFVDAMLRANPGLRGTVRTTLDLDLQRTAEWAVRTHLASLNRADITQAALVIIENSTGAVRALVGSSDFAQAQTNGALQSRSCGSTLKPFIYLAAIDRRLITAATLLPDTPDAIRDAYTDYDPQDFNHRYLGPVRVREALACSLNVPAVSAPAAHSIRCGNGAFNSTAPLTITARGSSSAMRASGWSISPPLTPASPAAALRCGRASSRIARRPSPAWRRRRPRPSSPISCAITTRAAGPSAPTRPSR